MKSLGGILYFVIFALGAFALGAPFGAAANPVDEIAQAERAFASAAQEKGYARSFYEYSSEDAIWFDPAPQNVHDALREDLAKPISPSRLRWRPYFIGTAQSQDFGFDYGPWYIENGHNKGWFFTIWQKQGADWRFSIDGGTAIEGAASDFPNLAPLRQHNMPMPKYGQNNGNDLRRQDEALNRALLSAQAHRRFVTSETIFATDGIETSLTANNRATHLSLRPKGEWRTLGMVAPSSADMLATYGTYYDESHAAKGEFIRLWVQTGLLRPKYRLLIDIYKPRPANP